MSCVRSRLRGLLSSYSPAEPSDRGLVPSIYSYAGAEVSTTERDQAQLSYCSLNKVYQHPMNC